MRTDEEAAMRRNAVKSCDDPADRGSPKVK